MDEQQNIIIYRTADGKASVALYARDGKIWLNQQQMAELFATSKPNISMHISNILKERELYKDSVVKDFLTTAADGKNYNVVFYSLCAQGDCPRVHLELRKAHQENDRAVMQAYGFPIKSTFTESQCVAELFKMYQELTK